MVKMPKMATKEELTALAAREEMAKGTIGAAAIRLVRAGEPVTWQAIISALNHEATSNDDVLAKGALKFIATLPPQQE